MTGRTGHTDRTRGWRARVDPTRYNFDGSLIYFFYPMGDGSTHYISFGQMERLTLSEGDMVPDDAGLRLPGGALEALTLELDPGPTRRDFLTLEATLAHEQQRVDDVLARAIQRISPGGTT